MSKTEAELIGDGLSSIAKSILGLGAVLAAAIESFPYQQRVASSMTSTEAQQRLTKLGDAYKSAIKEMARL